MLRKKHSKHKKEHKSKKHKRSKQDRKLGVDDMKRLLEAQAFIKQGPGGGVATPAVPPTPATPWTLR